MRENQKKTWVCLLWEMDEKAWHCNPSGPQGHGGSGDRTAGEAERRVWGISQRWPWPKTWRWEWQWQRTQKTLHWLSHQSVYLVPLSARCSKDLLWVPMHTLHLDLPPFFFTLLLCFCFCFLFSLSLSQTSKSSKASPFLRGCSCSWRWERKREEERGLDFCERCGST